MASKHARRISSLFSLGSNSSDKSVDTTKSSLSLAPPTYTDDPGTIFSEPVSTELQSPTLSDAQPSSLGPSLQTLPDVPLEAPLVPADNLLSSVPQMILPLPDSLSPQTVNRPRSSSESRIGLQVEKTERSEVEKYVQDRGGSRPASRVENKTENSPGSPTRPHQSEKRALSRRKSWLPTRSKPEPQSEAELSGPWIIHPDENLPYDASPLTQFHHVSTFSPSMLVQRY